MIEHAYTKNNKDKKLQGKSLSVIDDQICPRCGKETFRTGASIHFIPSKNQEHPAGIPGKDYEVEPIKYKE